nr:hypothetical protein GCM10020063_068200 [Dactylosporangium thailandense]
MVDRRAGQRGGGATRPGQLQRGPDRGAAGREVAAEVPQAGDAGERPRPGVLGRVRGGGERGLQPAQALDDVAAAVPEPAQVAGQPQRGAGAGRVRQPVGEGGARVVLLGLDGAEPPPRVRPAQRPVGLRGELAGPREVTAAQVGVAVGGEAALGVLPQVRSMR